MSKEPNYFDKLPDHLILFIFHKLDDLRSLLACQQTCLRFYSISYDRSLKKIIKLEGSDLEVGLLRKVISFANRDLLSLTVHCKRDENQDDKTVMTSKLFKRIYNKCPKLWFLEFDGIYSYSLRIQRLPRNLKHLAFHSCHFSFFSLFVKNCRNQYISRLDKIICLDLSHSTLFDSQNCFLLNNFQHLRYLYLEDLYRINNGGLYCLEPDILNKLLVFDVEGTEITCEIFLYVVKNCSSLLEFYFGNTFIDSSIMQLNKEKVKAKKLTKICIYNLDLNINSLNFIDDILTNLKQIDINNQLYTQVKSDNNLSPNLLKIFKVKDTNDSKTCLHYKDHCCNQYKLDQSS